MKGDTYIVEACFFDCPDRNRIYHIPCSAFEINGATDFVVLYDTIDHFLYLPKKYIIDIHRKNYELDEEASYTVYDNRESNTDSQTIPSDAFRQFSISHVLGRL